MPLTRRLHRWRRPGLADLIISCDGRLTASTDGRGAVLKSGVTFVVVPTPSEPDGRFSLSYVLDACEVIGSALSSKSGWHLVVVSSTVMPGDTDRYIRAALETASGKACGKDFGLCYSPEFIALGSVIRDFTNPDFVLIGESDARSGQALEDIYRNVCRNSPPIRRIEVVSFV